MVHRKLGRIEGEGLAVLSALNRFDVEEFDESIYELWEIDGTEVLWMPDAQSGTAIVDGRQTDWMRGTSAADIVTLSILNFAAMEREITGSSTGNRIGDVVKKSGTDWEAWLHDRNGPHLRHILLGQFKSKEDAMEAAQAACEEADEDGTSI